MTKSLSDVETVIRALLAAGPRDGRDVVAAMGERGFSPKQTRTAREKQNVIIERAGSGADMRSTWRLPNLTNPNIEQHRADLRKPEDGAPGESNAQAVGAFVAGLPERSERARDAIDADVRACRERGIPVIVRQVRATSVRATVRTDSPPAAPSVSKPALHPEVTESQAQFSLIDLTDVEQRRMAARVDAFMAQGIRAHDARKLADALVARDRDGLRATGSCAECQCVELGICPTVPRPVAEIHQCWYMRRCTP
jgi:hypothetical protein